MWDGTKSWGLWSSSPSPAGMAQAALPCTETGWPNAFPIFVTTSSCDPYNCAQVFDGQTIEISGMMFDEIANGVSANKKTKPATSGDGAVAQKEIPKRPASAPTAPKPKKRKTTTADTKPQTPTQPTPTKPPRNGYLLFCKESQGTLLEKSSQWNKMSVEDKANYNEKAKAMCKPVAAPSPSTGKKTSPPKEAKGDKVVRPLVHFVCGLPSYQLPTPNTCFLVSFPSNRP